MIRIASPESIHLGHRVPLSAIAQQPFDTGEPVLGQFRRSLVRGVGSGLARTHEHARRRFHRGRTPIGARRLGGRRGSRRGRWRGNTLLPSLFGFLLGAGRGGCLRTDGEIRHVALLGGSLGGPRPSARLAGLLSRCFAVSEGPRCRRRQLRRFTQWNRVVAVRCRLRRFRDHRRIGCRRRCGGRRPRLRRLRSLFVHECNQTDRQHHEGKRTETQPPAAPHARKPIPDRRAIDPAGRLFNATVERRRRLLGGTRPVQVGQIAIVVPTHRVSSSPRRSFAMA